MFFKKQYDPPEPIDGEDPPERTGFARFWEIFEDNYMAVLKVNLLFLLTCIPVVTIPVAIFALHHAARLMATGEIVRGAHYLNAFRQRWKQGYIAFVLTVLPLAMSGWGLWFYLRRAGEQILFFLPFVFCSTVFLVTLLSSLHLYGLLSMGYPTREALRLALALGVGRPGRAVLAALCCYATTLAAILAFPLSLMYLLLIGFSLPSLLGNFFLRIVWKQHLERTEEGE